MYDMVKVPAPNSVCTVVMHLFLHLKQMISVGYEYPLAQYGT